MAFGVNEICAAAAENIFDDLRNSVLTVQVTRAPKTSLRLCHPSLLRLLTRYFCSWGFDAHGNRGEVWTLIWIQKIPMAAENFDGEGAAGAEVRRAGMMRLISSRRRSRCDRDQSHPQEREQ